MKPILYWPLILLLLITEIVAVWLFLTSDVDARHTGTFMLHGAAAVGFGIAAGYRRKSLSAGLLGVLIVATNPIAGILILILIDDKFHRKTSKNFLETSGNHEVGNPFISADGVVEMADNAEMIKVSEVALIHRLMDKGSEITEREVEVVSVMRSLSSLPLLERIASVATGEGRTLSQAAISELSQHASDWTVNLHQLEFQKKPIPESMIRLILSTYLEVRKQGRSPKAFGLPSAEDLKSLLETKIATNPRAEMIEALVELLIQEGALDEASAVIETHRETRGFDYQIQQAKILSARGDWIGLLNCMSTVTPRQWQSQGEPVQRFWGTHSDPKLT